jgi:DNA-3-methyladenine glycosylase
MICSTQLVKRRETFSIASLRDVGINGTSFMLNVSSVTPGIGAGVLIREMKPTDGLSIMERNRGTERVRDLARARGGCAQPWASIADWTASTSVRRARFGSEPTVRRRAKSGRADGSALRAADSPLRFYARGNRFVSGPRALTT